MAVLEIRPESDCRWDSVSLGEVMIRFDPGEGRVRTARSFNVWEGGGEYNLSRALRKCFGMRTAVVTGIVENEVGRLLEDLIMQGGVDTTHVKWVPYDGVGKEVRVGFNFTEKGYGVRAALGTSDRGHTAASQLKAGDIDWQKIFKNEGTRWFHCGGIFAALSTTTPEVVQEAMQCARENGTIISYDLNYRASLWKSTGGPEKAMEVNRGLAQYVDVMIGNEEDFTMALGYKVEGLDEECSKLDPSNFKKMIGEVVKDFPNFKVVATTLRNAKTATVNDWGAVIYADGQFHEATLREDLEIYDRVGGGDSFASGLTYAFLTGKSAAEAVQWGAAHGALAMTTPGDTTMATIPEIEKVMAGKGARVVR